MPAYASGLREDDIILETNFSRIVEKSDFKEVMNTGVCSGDKIPVLVRRNKKTQCIILEVGGKLEDGSTVGISEVLVV